MRKKRIKNKPQKRANIYFDEDDKKLIFISTGCNLFDLDLGGGLPLGRISNIIGDPSSGKTQIAIEVSCNFKKQFPKGEVYYHEAESAFDIPYARSLGMPIKDIIFVSDEKQVKEDMKVIKDKEYDPYTIEGFFKRINEVTKREIPALYIVDSLDGLYSKEEIPGEPKNITGMRFGGIMSTELRQLKNKLQKSNTHLLVISQIRTKMATFGSNKTRKGGKALHFYASQEVWLNLMKKIEKQKDKSKRVIGINIKARNNKNKVGAPYRVTEFPILVDYGIDSDQADINYLKTLEHESIKGKKLDLLVEKIKRKKLKTYENIVKKVYEEINEKFRPKFKKY